MPRVKLDPRYAAKGFADVYRIKKVQQNVHNEDVAKMIGCSKATIANACREGNWTYERLRRLFKVMNYTDEEILKVMKL